MTSKDLSYKIVYHKKFLLKLLFRLRFFFFSRGGAGCMTSHVRVHARVWVGGCMCVYVRMCVRTSFVRILFDGHVKGDRLPDNLL